MEATRPIVRSSTAGFGFACAETLLCSAAVVFPVMLVCYFKRNPERFDQMLTTLTGPPVKSVIGIGFEFFGTSQKVLTRMINVVNDNGPEPFKILFVQFNGVVLNKPEDIQIVLNSSKALQKDQIIYRLFHNIFGDTLFTAPVDKWRKIRRVSTPPFGSAIMEQHNLVFNEKSQLLVKYLEKELNSAQPFNVLDYVGPNNLNIICQTAMGYNVDDRFNDLVEYMDAITRLCDLDVTRVVKPWLYPDIIFSIYIRLTGQQQIFKTIKQLPAQILEKKREENYAKRTAKNNTTDVEDTDDEKKYKKIFVDKILELDDPDVISGDDDLRDEIMSLIIAGSDTTSVSLSYCILLLAIHPDIQDKVYDEIYDVLGDDDRTITIEDTNKLVYMEKVLRETLRLYPIVSLIFRKLEDDVKLFSDDIVLRKGTRVLISPLTLHHSPVLYPNHWTFDPENFNDENVAKRHKYSWIPFSGGSRGCLGYKYAMVSMKVQMSTILRNYSVHTDWKLSDIELKFDTLIRSVRGYPITIRPRDRRPTFKRNKKL